MKDLAVVEKQIKIIKIKDKSDSWQMEMSYAT